MLRLEINIGYVPLAEAFARQSEVRTDFLRTYIIALVYLGHSQV